MLTARLLPTGQQCFGITHPGIASALDSLMSGDDKKKAAGAVDALLRKSDAHGCPEIVLPLICLAAGRILILMVVKSKSLSVLVDPKDLVPWLRDASII